VVTDPILVIFLQNLSPWKASYPDDVFSYQDLGHSPVPHVNEEQGSDQEGMMDNKRVKAKWK